NSVVEQILVTFNERVTLTSGAFNVTDLASSVTASGVAPTTLAAPLAVTATGVTGTGDAINGYTQYVLTFNPSSDVFSRDNSASPSLGNTFTTLKDGFYQLNTVGAN